MNQEHRDNLEKYLLCLLHGKEKATKEKVSWYLNKINEIRKPFSKLYKDNPSLLGAVIPLHFEGNKLYGIISTIRRDPRCISFKDIERAESHIAVMKSALKEQGE